MSDNTLKAPNDLAETTRTKSVGQNELELYRSLLQPAKEFKNGFTWTTVAGALFCGLLMMPGSIYLSLMTGQTIGAASWVTVIIFSEISRRALKSLNTQELVVLLYVAGAMSMGGPIAGLIFNQYLVNSDAVRDAGLQGQFPTWAVPSPDSPAILGRNLLHIDWLIPVLLVLFMYVISRITNYTMGYFFFRLTSDVEKLPFPFAPIQAQGAMALAESTEKTATPRWKLFSLGTVPGMLFAVIQIGIPLVTGALLTKPIQVIPIPWFDSTTITEGLLPATPTGITIDLLLVLIGMVMPFWAVVGSTAALILTMVMNPILYKFGVLHTWQPGMNTISTSYSNWLDFWMVFGLGVAAGVAVISIFQTVRDVIKTVKKAREMKAQTRGDVAKTDSPWATPAGRGDYSPWLALGIYFLCSTLIITVCHMLVPRFPVYFLIFFTFLYTPLISYVNAKLIGLCGNTVTIPFVREGAYILSGYRGIDIWMAPIPVDNFGDAAQSFRVNELTGTNFFSYIKAELLIVPLSFLLSFVFWAFIWNASAIPSENFPFAQQMWALQAKQTLVMWSSTTDIGGGVSPFMQALHPAVPGGGWTVGLGAFGFTVIAFTVMSAFGLPTMAIFGFMQGIGVMPHGLIPLIIGGLIGKFYLQKRFGQTQFLQSMPVFTAGYMTGLGLIALMGVAFSLIIKAISSAPF